MKPLLANPVLRRQEEWAGPPVAVLWDQSLLWGLICLESLQQLGVPCRLLSGQEIAEGALEPPQGAHGSGRVGFPQGACAR